MIQKKINEALLKIQEERKGRSKSGKWSPSSFGRCYRMQYWKRKAEPETNPPDVRALRIFKVGDMFHSFVREFLPSGASEVKVESDDILGYADYVTDDEVVDFKSQHSRAFWHMEREKNIDESKLTNILQVIAYAWLLKKPKARLVFISKDDLCIAEYVFSFDKWKDKLQHELDVLRDYWDSDTLPKAEPRAYGGKECKYCPFKIKCEEVENV